MCTNIRKVTNKYTGLSIFVSCGKCNACQQEKAAHRATRIRNNNKLGFIALFLTLTYDRLSCPVVFREDLHNRCNDLNVYRLCEVDRIRVGRHYEIGTRRKYKLSKLGVLNDVVYPSELQDTSIPKLAKLNSKYVGVCWYKDLQDFYKRFNAYIKYHYPYEDFKYSYYACSEYGESTFRPHFHSLLFIPAKYEKEARNAVLSCWSFGDRRRLGQYIQVAKDAASYVASYVNSDSDFPDLYKTSSFKQKHSYSKGFGVALECFSLSSVLEKTARGSLTYNTVIRHDGVSMVSSVLIPQYVINRYFPLYKGYSARSDGENRLFIGCPEKFARVPTKELYDLIQKSVDSKYSLKYDYFPLDKMFDKYNIRTVLSPDELRSISISLNNAYKYYHDVTGKNREDYAIDFVSVWRAYKSTVLHQFYDKASECSFVDCYDNVSDYVNNVVSSPNLDDFGLDVTSLDPNEMVANVQKTNRLLQTYELKKKTRKVCNYVMSRNGHYV